MQIEDTLVFIKSFIAAKRNFCRWKRREELAQWQETMIRHHLTKVLAKSAFFRGRIQADWRQTQFCTKRDMMGNFQRWNTENVSLEAALAVAIAAESSRDFTQKLNGLTVGLSSGTTGAKGVFLASHKETVQWAGTVLARILRGVPKKSRAALFLRAGSNLYSATDSKFFEFRFFDAITPIESQMESLNAFSPTILVAPPALLKAIAQTGLKRPPQQLISVAYMLEDEERKVIESAFGVKCDEIYQATEGFLAATCPHGWLHWNEDVVVVEKEWLDKTHYHPIITDFHRLTQPIIRYRMDDIIIEKQGVCPCGSVFERIGKIVGRADEVLQIPNKTTGILTPVLPDFICRAVIRALPTQSEYRVVQTAPTHLAIHLSAPENFANVCNEIAAMCETQGAVTPNMEVREYQYPEQTEKRRRVIRIK